MLLQADLWTLMMRSTVKVTEVDKALTELDNGTVRAHQVYKRCVADWGHMSMLSGISYCAPHHEHGQTQLNMFRHECLIRT